MALFVWDDFEEAIIQLFKVAVPILTWNRSRLWQDIFYHLSYDFGFNVGKNFFEWQRQAKIKVVRRGWGVGRDRQRVGRNWISGCDGLGIRCDRGCQDRQRDHEQGRRGNRIWSGGWSSSIEGHADDRGVSAELSESLANQSSKQRGKVSYHGGMCVSQPSTVMQVGVRTVDPGCKLSTEGWHVRVRDCFDGGGMGRNRDGGSARHCCR